MINLTKLIKKLVFEKADPDAVEEIDRELLDLVKPFVKLLKLYFRGEVSGIENVPKGKALLVGNHNAGITFMEPFLMGLSWYQQRPDEDLYFLAHDAMVAIPIVKNLLIKTGSIRASHKTAHAAFSKGKKVVVYPGGNYEAFRPFSERNRVDFGGKKGFIKLALREKVPIVPVCNVGGHETFFVLSPGHKLAKITGTKKYLRSESFPIFLGLPWIVGIGPIFHLPLPSKLVVKIGKPIYLDEYGEDAVNDPKALQEIYDKVQSTIQNMMDEITKNRKLPILG